MAHTITFNYLLSGEEYTASAGTKYEIAEGVEAVMRLPTAAIQDKAHEMLDAIIEGNEEADDLAFAKVVATCEKWPSKEECIPQVLAVIVHDFFASLRRITKLRLASPADASPSQPSPATVGAS